MINPKIELKCKLNELKDIAEVWNNSEIDYEERKEIIDDLKLHLCKNDIKIFTSHFLMLIEEILNTEQNINASKKQFTIKLKEALEITCFKSRQCLQDIKKVKNKNGKITGYLEWEKRGGVYYFNEEDLERIYTKRLEAGLIERREKEKEKKRIHLNVA